MDDHSLNKQFRDLHSILGFLGYKFTLANRKERMHLMLQRLSYNLLKM